MKFASLAALLLSASCALCADPVDTAYSALRVVGKEKGQAVLGKVIELRGRNGVPQPAVWKIIFNDPGARGGLREMEVQRGQVIGERAPTAQGVAGEAMDLAHLNLDSDGLFTLLNQEARRQGFAFDRVDYSLRSGSTSGSPVWTADLFSAREGKLATFQVAADSGAILSQNRTAPAQPGVNSDRDFLGSNPPQNNPPADGQDTGYSKPGERFRGVGDFFHRLGKRFERRGKQVGDLFTGKDSDGQ